MNPQILAQFIQVSGKRFSLGSPQQVIIPGATPLPQMNPYNVDVLGAGYNWSGTTIANSSADILDGSARVRWGTVNNPLGGSVPFQLARIMDSDLPVHGGVRAEATAAASLFPINQDTWAAWKLILPVGQWPSSGSPTSGGDRNTFCQIHTIDDFSPPFGLEFHGDDGLLRVITQSLTDGSGPGNDTLCGTPFPITRGAEANFILQYNRSYSGNAKINLWLAYGSTPASNAFAQVCNYTTTFGNSGVQGLADYMKGPVYKWTYLTSWGAFPDRTCYWRGPFIQTGNNLFDNAVASLQ